MRSKLPRLPRRRAERKRLRSIIRSTVEIVAGVPLAAVCVAVAFDVTDSMNLRLLIAIGLIIAAVLAEWGVRILIRRFRRG